MEGIVTEVTRYPKSKNVLVILGIPFRKTGIVLDFDERWAEQVCLFRQGNSLSAVGQISRVYTGGVMLDRCELISSQT